MDSLEAGRHWEANAEAWTVLSRQGYDRSRDHFNTPAFLRMLPDVQGLQGLDIGCGEGHNTRLLAHRGARMTALDLAPTFVRHALEAEHDAPLGLRYLRANGLELPFRGGSFDFVTGFMSFQDMPEQERLAAEVHRVLRPGGFVQFSITHPCFQTTRWRWLLDEHGRRDALVVGRYFDHPAVWVDQWTFGAAPAELKARFAPFRVPYFLRTLSDWLNLLTAAGLRIEQCAEPTPDDETLARHPEDYDARLIAYFLILRCRRGADTRAS